MSDTMRDYSCSAEYYFEYKIEKIFGEKGIKTPKLYFEKDYSSQTYSLYAIPEEWLERQEDVLNNIKDKNNAAEVRKALSKLEYDQISIVFDIKGVDCAPLSDNTSLDYQNAEIKSVISFEKFYEEGCRIMIENQNSQDHSGIGVIEMVKNGKSVAKFFFAINFTFRKKITYSIEIFGSRAVLEFKCKDRPVNIPVRVVYNKDRLPCLKNDMGVNVVAEFVLDFSKSSEYKLPIKLSGDAAKTGNVFSVTISDNAVARFYMLDCDNNSSLSIRSLKNFYPAVSYTCPYCHKKISYKVASSAQYKKGGITCQGTSVSSNGKALPVVNNKHRSKQKRCLYCSEDLTAEGKFKPNFMRLLPPSFMEHNNFKIAFAGSTRAGKTTYISRFFDLTGNDRISMPMTMTGNSLKQFGINVKAATIPRVKIDGDTYKLDDSDWTSREKHYVDRSINLDPPRYPQPTTTGDYTAYPFIAEVNNRAYISFYDIAGEDAQHTMQVQNIANGELIGVFCIINGKKDVYGNNGVFNMLRAAKLSKRCPIAIIVTKMDTLEHEFDSNCHCLRTDYFDGTTVYEESSLQREIDYSSEEIRSYLKHMSLMPDFDGTYENVKYFGVSSFDFIDSIHNEMEDINTPGKVKFECSSKRMELPFIWMLKQFDLIK